MAIESEAKVVQTAKIYETEVKRLDRLYKRVIALAFAFTVLISLASAVLWVLAEGEDGMGAPIGITGFIGAFGMFIVGFLAAFIIFSIVLFVPICIIMAIIYSKKKKKLIILIAAPSLNPDA